MIPEGWGQQQLHEIVQRGRKISYGIVQPGKFAPNGILLIRGKDYSFGWVPIEDFFRVTPEIDRPYRRSKVRPNDLLLTIVGAGTGNVAVVPSWLDGANITQTTARIAVDSDRHDPRFVRALLESRFGKIAVYRFIKGGAQPGLNIADVERFRFSFPPLPEQQKIAEILTTWDRAIETVEALIANARAQKKALMQSLLTSKKRLPGFKEDWTQTKLGELGKFQKGKGICRAEVRATGLPCVRYGEIYTHHDDIIRTFNSYIAAQSATESQRIQQGDIMFTCSGETVEEIGKCVAYLGDHEAYAGGDIVIFSPTQDSSIFLAYLLNSSPLAAQKSKMGQGNSVVHISASNLAKLNFSIPSRAEQDEIGKLLIEADNSILKMENQATALRQEKSALMQQLLTGKRRVKMDEGEDA